MKIIRYRLHTSSVPNINPNAHCIHMIIILYHDAFKTSCGRSATALGPKIIPAISHPKIAGNLSLLTTFPNKKSNQQRNNPILQYIMSHYSKMQKGVFSLKVKLFQKKILLTQFIYLLYRVSQLPILIS